MNQSPDYQAPPPDSAAPRQVALQPSGSGLLAMHCLALDAQAQHAGLLNQAIGLGVQAPHLAQHISVTQDHGVSLLVTPTFSDAAQWPFAMSITHVTNALGLLAHTQAQLLVVCTHDSDAIHLWCVPRLSMPDCGETAVRTEHAMAASHVSWPLTKFSNAPDLAYLEAISLSTRLLWLMQCMRADHAPRWSSELLSAVLQCEAFVGAGPDKGDRLQHFAPLHAQMAQAWLALLQFDGSYTPQAMRAIKAWAQQTRTLSDPLWRARAATVLAHAYLLNGLRGQDANALLLAGDILVHADVAALRVRDRMAWGLLHWHCAQAFEALWLMRRSQGWADLAPLLAVNAGGYVSGNSEDNSGRIDSGGGTAPAIGSQLDAQQNSAASVAWLRQSVAGFEQAVRVLPATCALGLWARLARGRTTQALGRAVSDQGVLMLATRVLDHLQVPLLDAERHMAAKDVASQVPLLMGETFASIARLRADKVQMVLALQQFEAAIESTTGTPSASSASQRASLQGAWANAQHGMGTSLMWLAQYDHGESQHLKYQRSVAAFTAALTARRLSSAPVDWSHTQAALGRAHALWSRAKPADQQALVRDESQHVVRHLEQAVAAYGLALSAPHTLGLVSYVGVANAAQDHLPSNASLANAFVRAQLLAELGGVWLELASQTGSAVSAQASIDCLRQALADTALPNSGLRVLLHNNLAAAYKQLSLMNGDLHACQAAGTHYAQALSLLQTKNAAAEAWLPVASNWTNAALRALCVPSTNTALAWALSWPDAPIGAANGAVDGAVNGAATGVTQAAAAADWPVPSAVAGSSKPHDEGGTQQHNTLQLLIKAFQTVLQQDPICALAHWQLARLYGAVYALKRPGAASHADLGQALVHGQALRVLLAADVRALSNVNLEQLDAWLRQCALVQVVCTLNRREAKQHLELLRTALDSWKLASRTGSPVWLALSRRVLGVLVDDPESLVRADFELAPALHQVWQIDSQHAANLERTVTFVDAQLQRLQSADTA